MRTPLALFALVVLMVEAILVPLSVRVEGTDRTILVAGMLLLLLTIVAAVILTHRDMANEVRDDTDVTKRKYDVFLASVLAGFEDETKFLAERKNALAIAEALKRECGFNVYYAGREVKATKEFDPSHLGAKQDIDALRDSRHFLLIFPEKVASSVLFEAGYAYQRCQTSTYFVHNRSDLPYLMSRLPELHSDFVRLFNYETAADIVKLIKTHRQHLFDWRSNE